MLHLMRANSTTSTLGVLSGKSQAEILPSCLSLQHLPPGRASSHLRSKKEHHRWAFSHTWLS